MPLTVLSDDDVHGLLHNLSKDELEVFRGNLGNALHEYSTGAQDVPACSSNQPSRIQLCGKGKTTLVIPAQTSAATGVKVVTVGTPPPLPATPESSRSSFNTSTSANGSNPSLNSTRDSSLYSLPSLPSTTTGTSTAPTGTLTLLSPAGTPIALVAASSLTAFRTALASTLLLQKRTRLHSIAVFGAGAQAYWHIRLALLLRGADIHHVRIINRSFAGAEPLLKTIMTDPSWAALRGANPKLDFSVLSAEFGEYPRLLKEHVRDADAIFFCTPATTPLFPHEFLTSSEGRKKGRFLSLIGSYREHMLEVHPEVLRQAVAPDHGHMHFHRHAERGGAILVDSLDACMKEAGEIIQAGLKAQQLVEIGELIMVKRAVMKEIGEMGGAGEPGLKRWLEAGNVIYKSVGLGVMDVSVGQDLVQLAEAMNVGVRIDNF